METLRLRGGASEQPKTSTKPPPPQPPQNVSLVDLDSRHSKQEHKEEKNLRKDKKEADAASRENLRPIPDGDFELIPLREDPSRNLKIGKDVPDLARKQLVACLKDNADLFAWSASEMPGLDPNIACHQLTVDEAASVVVQRYNQIPMAVADRTKTAFMTESGNYYYNVMPFGLKNVGATYQRMMNKVFRGEIGDMLEVYMDDMIVKSHEEVDHTIHLQKVFEQARKVNMKFNPEKCTFGIRAGKFLGFYLTERGIEANPDKCRAFTEFPTPNDKNSIQTLNGILTALSRFVAKSAQHALPLFKLLRKEFAFEWTEECFSATLIRETLEGKKPVYFTSKDLQGPELRYQRIEKVALALVTAARRLRYYFLAHTIVVRTDQPIKSLLVRPDMTIFVDGASNATGAGTGIILENEEGILIEVSLALSFPTSNNQAEYETFLVGLRLAEDVGAKEIKIYTDSQLVASQVLGEYQVKNDNLSEYLALVKERITKFDSAEIQHVPREHNKRADILSKLASTKRKNGNKSCTTIFAHGTLPNDEKEAATVKRRACSYTLLDNKLYRRGFSIPLLKCADEATADYILREIHEGINSQHLGGRSLARKALRAGYYWPTMQQDAKEHVKKCDKCQRHGDMHLAPRHELKSLSSAWPFAWWGMDILGPFTRGNLQFRYLIV
ncbi:hypothetical protein TSUD_371820 [Trifolium subterraneum]|uniref:RNase H type-1 domain-containing protein n=1 Tax=Trifolium subterraneum TaxID=3900 RepID=A0A2Z6P6W9_TRISU|nr:hypothetical protein TSUD_371820 [Trifolium subterraneum]